MPWWDDMGTGTNGNVQYQLLGTSPNRKLVVEWRVRNIGRDGQLYQDLSTLVVRKQLCHSIRVWDRHRRILGIDRHVNIGYRVPECYDHVEYRFDDNACQYPVHISRIRSVLFIYACLCAGTPSPGNTLASANPVCSGSALTLSMSTPPSSVGITYRWQTSPDGSTWTNVAGATGNNVTLTANPTTSTYYRCRVTCNIRPQWLLDTFVGQRGKLL